MRSIVTSERHVKTILTVAEASMHSDLSSGVVLSHYIELVVSNIAFACFIRLDSLQALVLYRWSLKDIGRLVLIVIVIEVDARKWLTIHRREESFIAFVVALKSKILFQVYVTF